MAVDKELRFVRAPHRVRASQSRPLSHIMRGDEALDLEQVTNVRYGTGRSQRIQVESPYKEGEFVRSFWLDCLTGAIIHDRVGRLAESSYRRLGELSVLWHDVQVEEGCRIGTFSELRQRVRLRENVTVQAGAVVCKDSDLGRYAHVLEGAFVGKKSHIKPGATVGFAFQGGAHVRLDRGVYTASFVYAQAGVHVNEAATVLDGAYLGANSVVEATAAVRPGERVVGDGVVAIGFVAAGNGMEVDETSAELHRIIAEAR